MFFYIFHFDAREHIYVRELRKKRFVFFFFKYIHFDLQCDFLNWPHCVEKKKNHQDLTDCMKNDDDCSNSNGTDVTLKSTDTYFTLAYFK